MQCSKCKKKISNSETEPFLCAECFQKMRNAGSSNPFSRIFASGVASTGATQTTPQYTLKNTSGQTNLKLYGEVFEVDGYDEVIKKRFPNYEVFWEKYVLPRRVSRDVPRFKPTLTKEEEMICIINYTIYKHFYSIYCTLHNMKTYTAESGENIIRSSYEISQYNFSYIRLASVIDLFEEFLFNILIQLKEINYDNAWDIFCKEFEPDISKHKEKLFDKLKEGNIYPIPINVRQKVISSKFDDFKEVIPIAQDIRRYRNIIVHSWEYVSAGTKVLKKELITKDDYLGYYHTWNSILQDIEKDLSKRNEFLIEHREQLTKDFDLLMDKINTVLGKLIDKYGDKLFKKHED